MTDLLDRVAGAPITWGVCEVPAWGHRMEPDRVLSEMASIGMRATELGPAGFLPNDPSALQEVLRRHGLRLVGGFVPVVLHRPDRWQEELAALEAAVISMAEAGADAAVLAASGSDDSYETSDELDDDEWRHLGIALEEATEVCGRHGLAVSLHPHLGTVVESPEQIERALAESTVPLCLDTGHVLAGGGDPVKIALEYRDRVAHVHLKDVDAAMADAGPAGRVELPPCRVRWPLPPPGRGRCGPGHCDHRPRGSRVRRLVRPGAGCSSQSRTRAGQRTGGGCFREYAVAGGPVLDNGVARMTGRDKGSQQTRVKQKEEDVTRKSWLALTGVILVVLAACGGDGGTATTAGDGGTDTTAVGGTDTTAAGTGSTEAGGGVTQRDYTFEVVTHGQASDPFWSVAANGVAAAAEDMGVTANYQAPGTFDMVAMSQIIDTAVAGQPDGLVVSIPDADALGPSIQAAVDAGIPVISMNSGSDVFADLGVLAHVGQTEREAGLIAGLAFAEAGVTNALCINQEVGNVALDLRCEGFDEGLGGTVEVIPVDLNDPTGAQQSVASALQANADANGILTLGPTGAIPTLAALDEAGSLGTITFATFDLSPEVLQAITDGDMAFAIDQAQYLQGYLPIVLLTQYLETGAIPLGSVER